MVSAFFKELIAMLRDFENTTVIAGNVDPVVANTAADEDGTTVDLLGYNHCVFIGQMGVEGDTLSGTNSLIFEMEESDDDSSWTDCADASITNAVTGDVVGTWAVADADAEIPAVFFSEYKGSKRYVRAVLNTKGTHSTGTPVSIVAVKFGAANLPAS